MMMTKTFRGGGEGTWTKNYGRGNERAEESTAECVRAAAVRMEARQAAIQDAE